MKDENWEDRDATDGKARGAEPITIKKYANRRLYNTALSQYITLDDLAAMVRSGQDFVVQDAKSGADLTRAVLTQIIFEQESRENPMLPVSFLRRLIRMYGDAVQGAVPGYLEASMAAFEQNQEAFRRQIERSFGSAPGFQQLDAMVRANMEIMRQAAEMFAPFTPGAGGSKPSENSSATDPSKHEASAVRDAEVAALHAQVSALQERLEALAKR